MFLALFPGITLAQTDKSTQKDEHEIEKLVISASPLKRTVLESATPVTILSGDALDQNQAATLGETLKNVPGVHSSYFGPVSSSPIIRGLDGPRIKVVQNGMDASDASRVGPDHLVSTEVSTATQIEVLRGPATLLYGSGAIGGVVNVVDNRLPLQQQNELSGELVGLYDSVSNERTFSTDLNGGAGALAWHFDAFDRSTDDYKLPDGILNEEGEIEEELDNSAIDAQGFTVGGGWIEGNTRLAFSYGRLESDYGIPGHGHGLHGHAEEEGEEEAHSEEEPVFARMTQDRYQAVADWLNLDGPIAALHWHNAYTDYQHGEIEDGMTGTTFSNKTLESRLWGEHQPLLGWQGVLGVHYKDTDFAAVGDEAFTPPTQSQSLAFFLLEEKPVGDILWQWGARIEDTRHQVDNEFFHDQAHEHEGEDHEIAFDEQSYTSFSGSLGLVYSLDQHQSVAVNLAHSQRAPSASEIFANGPHIATSTFEVGGGFEILEVDGEYELSQSSQTMREEISNNLDLSYRYHSDLWSGSVSLFYNQVDNYVFQRDTNLLMLDGHLHPADELDIIDEHGHEEGAALPVYQFAQQDAKLYGFEAQMDWHFHEYWRLDLFADYTRAELDKGGNLPRIPPLRLGSSVHFEVDNWHLEAGATHYAKQEKIGASETETEGYTLVSASINYYLPMNMADMTLFIKGENLSDQEARVHSSFLKDVAPLPGRSIKLGVKGRF
ncbi:TonB-dependent receptor [Aliiglaciecola sp. CAU 1673]|uniref:TonB-dependent receptor n=1 Tax=Aliiglaciecola sp. CAU 1673 TaxID=3032595 RepID=UPI0023DAF00E|nr:TonB-dependent receptor [Aliiglaciecola sp. CAU 1673]MDF2178650.1 TonB-dependent receptor [Aliiglaciecola sp. CAU 1673]